jgi:hypothetical protein
VAGAHERRRYDGSMRHRLHPDAVAFFAAAVAYVSACDRIAAPRDREGRR